MKTIKDQEILYAKRIRDQDGRVETGFVKLGGKISQAICSPPAGPCRGAGWEMALVVSYPWHQVLTVADTIPYSVLDIRLTESWRQASRKLLFLSAPCTW